MENLQNNEPSMKELMEQGYDFKRIHRGDIVKGKVINVTDKEVFLNINYISDGIVPKEELVDDYDADIRELFKENDILEVMILEANDGEGNVLLSKKKAASIKIWDVLKDNLDKDATFKVKVNEVVKGGVVAKFDGIRAFIPASQLALSYVSDLNFFLGKELEVKVMELDKDKNKVILSAKAVEKAKQEEEVKGLWNKLKAGEKREGTVIRLAKFGAFVDIGGIQGLVHNSDLSWKRILDPSEVVSVGDKVEVYVVDFDKAKNRVSLALKEVNSNPWNSVREKYKVNDVVEGIISNLVNFGAFAELEPGIEGLVPLENISEDRVVKASDVLKIGDKVKVKIMDINFENHRMSLSIKDANVSTENYAEYNDKEESMTLADLLGDKLKGLKFD